MLNFILHILYSESQFISCSVEVTGRFMAELHKNEAEKLKGLFSIRASFFLELPENRKT